MRYKGDGPAALRVREGRQPYDAAVLCQLGEPMADEKIPYPKSLRDIPRWRQREIEEDLRWFLRFSPSKRLEYIDREWDEARRFIDRFGFKRRWKRRKKSDSST